MKRKLAITFTLILVLAVLTGCMSPKSASMLGEKPNQPSIEQETQTTNPPSTEPKTQQTNPPSTKPKTQPSNPLSTEPKTQQTNPPSTEPKTQPSNPLSTEPKTPPLNPPSKKQETQPSNPPVPGEGVALKINSLDKLNYYGALRMIAGTPMVSKQSMADDSYGIVLLAGGVGNDREEAPTVPDTTDLAVALPDATETAPTVPDTTELTEALPDATETAPTVPDATEPVSTEGPPLAPDKPTTTNPGKNIYYYQLKPNQPFNMKKVNIFQIELTDENGFLASKLGLGLVDVVISENCIWGDSLITFRNGDQFFSCLTNGRRLNTKTGGQQWNFSTHKYVEGFNIVKNFQQENYAFYIDVDAEGQIFAFECRVSQNGGDRVDQNVRIVSATRISTQGGTITVAELEDYFNNGSAL